jgi:hypothetical protein
VLFNDGWKFMGGFMSTIKVEPLDTKLEVVVIGVSDVDGTGTRPT